MGIALWTAAGVFAWAIARFVPAGRPAGRGGGELAVAVVLALLAGVFATALDFGGWAEPDWRAVTFTLLAGFAAIGGLRAARLR